MSEFILFGTEGCHLCEEAESILHAVGVDFRIVDIMTENFWQEKYGLLIPVLLNDKSQEHLAWPFDCAAVKDFLLGINNA